MNGFASFNVNLSTLGTHKLYVAYPGDGPFAASSSGSIPLTVVASTATVTTLTTSATSVPHGTVVVLTAKVTSGGLNVTSGNVSCKAAAAHCADLNLLASAQLTANGTAIARLALPAGSTAIQARFKGAAVLKPSTSSTQAVTVTGNYPVSIAISTSGAPDNYSVTADVTGQSGQPLPFSPSQLTDTSNGNLGLGFAYLSAKQVPFSLKTKLIGLSGESPTHLITGDFNNDGKIDAVFGGASSGVVNVFLGNGDGTFQALPSTINLGAILGGMAVGDFNGDGNLDFVAADVANNRLVVELGNGDGTFTRKSIPATGIAPDVLTVADFNNDGILDIAVTNIGSSSVTILLGNGDGTFTSDPVFSTNIRYPFSIAAADFDGDGNMDLAIGCYPSGLVIL